MKTTERTAQRRYCYLYLTLRHWVGVCVCVLLRLVQKQNRSNKKISSLLITPKFGQKMKTFILLITRYHFFLSFHLSSTLQKFTVVSLQLILFLKTQTLQNNLFSIFKAQMMHNNFRLNVPIILLFFFLHFWFNFWGRWRQILFCPFFTSFFFCLHKNKFHVFVQTLGLGLSAYFCYFSSSMCTEVK